MDPAERERCDMMGWLNQCIDTLNIQVQAYIFFDIWLNLQCQVDQFEAEIESLVGAAGKKKKGKSDADARSEECQQWVSGSSDSCDSSNDSKHPEISTLSQFWKQLFVRSKNTETTYRSWRPC